MVAYSCKTTSVYYRASARSKRKAIPEAWETTKARLHKVHTSVRRRLNILAAIDFPVEHWPFDHKVLALKYPYVDHHIDAGVGSIPDRPIVCPDFQRDVPFA